MRQREQSDGADQRSRRHHQRAAMAIDEAADDGRDKAAGREC